MSLLSKIIKKNKKGLARLAGKVVNLTPAGYAINKITGGKVNLGNLATKALGGSPRPSVSLGDVTVQLPQNLPQDIRQALGPMNGTAAVAAAGTCPVGFRPNKSGYFLKDGTYIAPGTRCVRNRRQNPMNFKASKRAARRLKSGIKHFRKIYQITTGKAAGKVTPRKGR
jgi:hypothetical protein